MSDARSFTHRCTYLPFLVTGVCLIALWPGSPPSYGTPPEYASFQRRQAQEYQMAEQDVMRIWVVYVGQGDGILIQLPSRYNYDLDPADGDNARTERIDILIDGGSHNKGDSTRMADFLLELYDQPIMEHAVISHHDSDHVIGLTHILADTPIGVQSIYHNGLATYRSGKRGFSNATTSDEAVIDGADSNFRGMAFLEPDDDGQGRKLRAADLVDSRATLAGRLNDGEFRDIYQGLAQAIVEKEDPFEVDDFQRCWSGSEFIKERETRRARTAEMSSLQFRVLWPLERPRRYDKWSETINGNSLTFRLDYGDFSMLFTGDLNEKSEEKLLAYLAQTNRSALLNVDVLKVPHHGSRHGVEAFFEQKDDQGARVPVVAVASMGSRGFCQSWKHPNPEVIDWLGGSHRVYHTFVEEKKFQWDDLTSPSKLKAMQETTHVLIETDGRWFRIVEVPVEGGDLHHPPGIRETRRADGTRWIQAR